MLPSMDQFDSERLSNRGLCNEDQPQRFVCANQEVFATAAIIWGLIGPQRQFAANQIYYGQYSVPMLQVAFAY